MLRPRLFHTCHRHLRGTGSPASHRPSRGTVLPGGGERPMNSHCVPVTTGERP